MRNISFMLTKRQVRNRTKDVTRRLGWRFAKAGMVLQPVEKGQGLKKGQKVRRIGKPIRVVCVTREPLRLMAANRAYGLRECRREGYPELTPEAFIAKFIVSHGGPTRVSFDTVVTRIEFEYLEGPDGHR